MALLSWATNMFSGNKEPAAGPPAANPAVQQQQQAAAGANPSVPSSTTPVSDGSMPAIPAVGKELQSPLAKFSELWKAEPAPAAGSPPPPSLVPNFNLDPAAIMAQAQKINFLSGVNAELLEKAKAGDMGALLDVINQSNQFAFASGTAASGELVRNSLTSAQGVLKDSILPGEFRRREVTQALTASNPVFSNPAVAPMLNMLQQQFQIKNPTASPSEIAAAATQYLDEMSQTIVSASGGQVVSKQQLQAANGGYGQKPVENWERFFDV